MKKLIIGIGIVILVLVGVLAVFKNTLIQLVFRPTSTTTQMGSPIDNKSIEVVSENLQIPWEIAFLPDQSLLVTERPGRLVRIFPDTKKVITVENVEPVGEGGLLGLVLHPDFQKNNWLYLYHTTRTAQGLRNQVERFTFDSQNNHLNDKKIIIENIPASSNHDGGRLAFGPDKLLYITTGDAENSDNAQNRESLAGKILRVKDDGTFPSDNPFNSAIYSYGHRNPQGIAWDDQGRMWETEHGPSGVQTGNDEVNMIEKGKNYGWPTIKGTQTHEGMVSPLLESGTKETWAPASAEIVQGKLFFGGLRGESLYSVDLGNDNRLNNLTAHFAQEFGRIRTVRLSPDKSWLYISTSNTDGRGKANAADDKIIRLKASLFF